MTWKRKITIYATGGCNCKTCEILRNRLNNWRKKNWEWVLDYSAIQRKKKYAKNKGKKLDENKEYYRERILQEAPPTSVARSRWLDRDKNYLIENWHKKTNLELAKVLGRTESSVRHLRIKLNLEPKCHKRIIGAKTITRLKKIARQNRKI